MFLASLALWGCGGSISVLESMDGTGVEVCTPQQQGTGRAVIAISEFKVTGDRDVTVTEVALVDAQGLELVGYDFGDFEDPDFRIVGYDYETHGPPAQFTETTLRAGNSYVIKVGLAAGKEGGSASAVAVKYRAGDYAPVATLRTQIEMQVAAAGEVCTG